MKNSSYDDIAERSKIAKAAILAVLEVVLAAAESAAATATVTLFQQLHCRFLSSGKAVAILLSLIHI